MQPPREFPNARKYIFQVPQLFYQPDVALGLILEKRQDKTGMAFFCGVVVASSAAGNSCYTDREESEKTVQPNSFSKLIPAAYNYKNNAQETYVCVSDLRFCHLRVISLHTLSSIAIEGE